MSTKQYCCLATGNAAADFRIAEDAGPKIEERALTLPGSNGEPIRIETQEAIVPGCKVVAKEPIPAEAVVMCHGPKNGGGVLNASQAQQDEAARAFPSTYRTSLLPMVILSSFSRVYPPEMDRTSRCNSWVYSLDTGP